jgi:hypothetical protein
MFRPLSMAALGWALALPAAPAGLDDRFDLSAGFHVYHATTAESVLAHDGKAVFFGVSPNRIIGRLLQAEQPATATKAAKPGPGRAKAGRPGGRGRRVSAVGTKSL